MLKVKLKKSDKQCQQISRKEAFCLREHIYLIVFSNSKGGHALNFYCSIYDSIGKKKG